jgi:ACS family pantothenate transporter-like MFS transporter
MLPENGVRVGAVVSFDGDFSCDEKMHKLLDDTPIPFTVTLQSGQKLCNFHYVVVCTGYHFSFPFLSHLHEDHTLVDKACEKVLVTDGERVHNLYKHIFYMPDPTLAFIGLPYHVSTWNLYDYQTIAVAAVFSGRAILPSKKDMREEYLEWIKSKQGDKNFHSLGGDEENYIESLLVWINEGAALKGFPAVPGHTPEFHAAKAEHIKRLIPLFDQYDGSADPALFVNTLPVCI